MSRKWPRIKTTYRLECPRCGSHLNYEGIWPTRDKFAESMHRAFWKDHGKCRYVAVHGTAGAPSAGARE